MNYTSCVLIFFVSMHNYHCLKIIPERASLTYLNPEYVENGYLNVRRYSRKGDYVVNLSFTNKLEFGNDVKADIIFYQYLHNEFRRSFVEMHYKLCDLINDEPYLGGALRRGGLTCPLPAGTHSASNITFNQNFPFVWPFEKGMAEFVIHFAKTNVLIGKGEVVLTFKADLKTKQ